MCRNLMMAMMSLGQKSMRRQLPNSFGEWLQHWQAPTSLLLSLLLGASIAIAWNFAKLSHRSELTTITLLPTSNDCKAVSASSPPPRSWSDSEPMLASSNSLPLPLRKHSTNSPAKYETFILGRCHHGTKPHQHRLREEQDQLILAKAKERARP